VRVLGIDPGTIHMGYGVVDEQAGDMALAAAGVLQAPAREPIERRLLILFHQLQELLREHRPQAVAVEEPFVVQAPRNAAMAVGEARAIALLAAAQCGLPVAQYTPAKVRSTVCDYGAGDKAQVRDMVSILLREPLDALSLDASDAVAVAICHLRHAALDELLSANPLPARRARSRR
jgi:crossover junction endodeoxyribonuclease RuvC